MATIPDPPEGGPGGGPPAATFQEIFDFVQAFAKDNGFAVVKMKPSNKREGIYCRYELHCDRGHRRPQRGEGLRSTSTRKIDCPWKMIASATRATD